jgi:hypothetical protein
MHASTYTRSLCNPIISTPERWTLVHALCCVDAHVRTCALYTPSVPWLIHFLCCASSGAQAWQQLILALDEQDVCEVDKHDFLRLFGQPRELNEVGAWIFEGRKRSEMHAGEADHCV